LRGDLVLKSQGINSENLDKYW